MEHQAKITAKILVGDCIEQMRGLESGSVDAVVTDPPYGLVGNSRGGSSQPGDLNTPYGRSGPSKKRGFMGKEWDGSGIENNVDMWKECFRLLKPGGHLLSFGGSRTYHRMACAIEDAGFDIRDQIMWVYGSGFPKSLSVGKAVDKRGGTTSDQSREFAEYIKNRRNELNITLSKADEVICGGTTNYSWFEGRPAGQRLPRKTDYLKMKELLKLNNRYDSFMEETEREFLGNYETDMGELGGERLGVSGGNITKGTSEWEGFGTALKPAHEPICLARKPITGTVAENVLKHGCGGLNIDGCRVEIDPKVDDPRLGGKGSWGTENAAKNVYEGGYAGVRVGSSEQGRWPANFCHDGSDEVLQLFPNSSGQAGIVKGTEPSQTGGDGTACYGKYGRVAADKRGDLGSAARFFFCAKASKQDRNSGGVKSDHPTVKPHALMRWLCRLITPPNGTILDPFMGSGSTGKAAIKEGFSFVGIELDPEYAEIARKRIEAVKYIPKAKVLPRYREQEEVRRKPQQQEMF